MTETYYAFPVNHFPAYAFPQYHWPGQYGWGFGEVYELSAQLNMTIAEFVVMMTVVSAIVERKLSETASVIMARDVSENVVLNKSVSNDYSELERL